MDIYLFYKAVHIISVISWLAGMLYLPRIFVYHCNQSNSKDTNAVFSLMEKRLLKYIMNPAMILTWVFGALMTLHAEFSINILSLWFIIKIVCVVLMSGFHGYFSYCCKQLEKDNSFKSSKFFRIVNEVPTILMIIIIFMVVMRPYN